MLHAGHQIGDRELLHRPIPCSISRHLIRETQIIGGKIGAAKIQTQQTAVNL